MELAWRKLACLISARAVSASSRAASFSPERSSASASVRTAARAGASASNCGGSDCGCGCCGAAPGRTGLRVAQRIGNAKDRCAGQNATVSGQATNRTMGRNRFVPVLCQLLTLLWNCQGAEKTVPTTRCDGPRDTISGLQWLAGKVDCSAVDFKHTSDDFVPQDGWDFTAAASCEGVQVTSADCAQGDLHQYFTRRDGRDGDFKQFQRLSRPVKYGGGR